MTRKRSSVVLLLVVALVAAGCSSGSTGSSPETTVIGASPSTTVPAPTEGDTPTTTATPPTTKAEETTAEPVFNEVEPIVQTTPVSGRGTRPLLEWQSVDGASAYIVTVYSETGGPYWSAVTVDTQTYVGGPLQIPEGRSGPIVSDGYTWVVIARDPDGGLLAASPRRPISP